MKPVTFCLDIIPCIQNSTSVEFSHMKTPAENTEQRYQAALDYLYSFVDYSLTKQLTYSPEKFNLDRMVALLDKMQNPHKSLKIVHVTGTKGKGSVCAMLAQILRVAGYNVGLYTSPHLIRYNERIQVNGEAISDEDLINQVNKIKGNVALVPGITTFEITTAIAFEYFVRKNVDIAIIEVGLGGRLDATNVVDPLLSIITTISYDHQSVLGNTLTEIAGEKAGIIKTGKPVVVSSQSSEASLVLNACAEKMHAPISIVGKDIFYCPVEHNLDGQTFHMWTTEDHPLMDAFIEMGPYSGWQPQTFQIPLIGAHQLENAATAFLAIKRLQDAGIAIPHEAIEKGYQTVAWPCRMEVLDKKPVVILDSAHNRDSALKLRLALDDYLPSRKITLVFGASEDKDVRGMLIDLLPRVEQLIATRSIHPRALEPDQIVAYAHQMGHKAIAIVPFEEAMDTAIRTAGKDSVVLIAGSIFVAAAAKEYWQKKYE